MSEELERFGALLNEREKGNVQISTRWAIVMDVYWDNKTCDVKDLADNLEYYDVFLGLGCVYKRPIKDTKCLIGVINNSPQAFLIECEQWDLVQFGDGLANGLIKIDNLKMELEKLNTMWTAFKSIINGAPIPEAGNGVTSAFQTALKSAFVGKNNPSYSDIENEKITHG